MPAQEDYEAIEGMADRLGLEGDERGKYVQEHMQRFGYKPRTVWEDAEPEEGDDENVSQGFFGGGKKTAAPKRTREVGKQSQPPRRSSDWQYGG